MRRIILVDMDSILVDLQPVWYDIYNEEWDDNLDHERVKGWDIDRYVKPECGKKVYDILRRPGLYRNLPEVPGAVEAVKQLSKTNEVYIVSAANSIGPLVASDKMLWMAEHCPFIKPGRVGIFDDKYLITGNVLIDDGPHNMVKYRQVHPHATIVTIEYPYNRHALDVADHVARDYRHQQEAWDSIMKFLEG